LLPAVTLLGIVAMAGAQESGDDSIRYAEKMPLADEALVLDATPTSFGAVAVGAHGHILLTEQFTEWRQAESVPTRATLTAVDFVGRTGWAVGHDSVILRTTDAGRTWERQYFDPERQQPFMDVHFFDAERGVAVGAYDLFMTTADGGRSWTDTGGVDPADDWHLNDFLVSADGTWVIAAEQGLIYRSTDEGDTWESVQLPYQGSMFGILEVRPNRLLTFGLRGHAYRSSDSGATWQRAQTATDSSLFGGRVLQSGAVVLVGGGGTITESSPGARSFNAREHSDGESLAGVIQDRSGNFIYYGINGIGLDPAEEGAE